MKYYSYLITQHSMHTFYVFFNNKYTTLSFTQFPRYIGCHGNMLIISSKLPDPDFYHTLK